MHQLRWCGCWPYLCFWDELLIVVLYICSKAIVGVDTRRVHFTLSSFTISSKSKLGICCNMRTFIEWFKCGSALCCAYLLPQNVADKAGTCLLCWRRMSLHFALLFSFLPHCRLRMPRDNLLAFTEQTVFAITAFVWSDLGCWKSKIRCRGNKEKAKFSDPLPKQHPNKVAPRSASSWIPLSSSASRWWCCLCFGRHRVASYPKDILILIVKSGARTRLADRPRPTFLELTTTTCLRSQNPRPSHHHHFKGNLLTIEIESKLQASNLPTRWHIS